MPTPKFERQNSRRQPTSDDTGSVRVTVILYEGSSNKKGNITRSLTVDKAKVSDVFAAIEQALFSG